MHKLFPHPRRKMLALLVPVLTSYDGDGTDEGTTERIPSIRYAILAIQRVLDGRMVSTPQLRICAARECRLQISDIRSLRRLGRSDEPYELG